MNQIISKIIDLNKTNDVIIYPSTQTAKYNLLFFHGDVQNYKEDMLKNPSSRNYLEWNLIDTAGLLVNRFAQAHCNVNVFIVKADQMYMKSFANYSNFVSTDKYGTPSTEQIQTNSLEMLVYLEKLYQNSIYEYNKRLNDVTKEIKPSLALILCAFSKGCVCLNQLCNELSVCQNIQNGISVSLESFIKSLKHIIWLDSGHQGLVNVWPTDSKVIENILALKASQICFYVFTTPYQVSEQNYDKQIAVSEFKIFIKILSDLMPGKFKSETYFDKADLVSHFNLLKVFDCQLIED